MLTYDAQMPLPADPVADAASTPGPVPDAAAVPIPEPGVLTLAATPIGNPLDASVRLARALAGADLVAAEDTRRLQRLARSLQIGVRGEVIAYHEHNEDQRTPILLEAVRAGRSVLIVTDAGMPSVSDPGYRAVRAAIEADLPITVIPGPSAVLTALTASGMASDRFSFEGFAPRTSARRRTEFARQAAEDRTLIYFESPRRTAATLADMAAAFGAERPAAVARELTKTHEEVLRAPLGELAAWAGASEVLGEIVIVVGGSRTVAVHGEDVVDRVLALAAEGQRLKDAAKAVAAVSEGVSSRELYDLALRAQREQTAAAAPEQE